MVHEETGDVDLTWFFSGFDQLPFHEPQRLLEDPDKKSYENRGDDGTFPYSADFLEPAERQDDCEDDDR